MVDKNIEQRIYTAVSNATPDMLDKIYASCDEQKGRRTTMNNNQRNKKGKWIGSLVAAAVLLLVGVSGFTVNRWNVNNTVNSKVILDVNPSVSINVNAKERVLSVEAGNDDGKKIIGDMELENTKLDVAVNALVGSMLQNGYLTDIQNAILVSVENNDVEKGAILQAKLANIIEQMLQNTQFDSLVFSQTVDPNQRVKELSSKHNISEGKVVLINELIEQNNNLTFEELAKSTVHEIALIMESKGIETKEVSRIGHASEKAYIGKEEAKAIVFDHAKVDSSKVKLEEIEFDTDDGIMIYEIEFKVGKSEYKYDVNAITGEVISFSKEVDDDDDNNNETEVSYIGKAKAKTLALQHAGVNEADVREYEAELDKDDGIVMYEIEFETNKAEYKYEIDAKTGGILDYEIELDDDDDDDDDRQ